LKPRIPFSWAGTHPRDSAPTGPTSPMPRQTPATAQPVRTTGEPAARTTPSPKWSCQITSKFPPTTLGHKAPLSSLGLLLLNGSMQPGAKVTGTSSFASRIMWNGLLARGLIDELHLMVSPTAIAEGVPIFNVPASLNLMESRRFQNSNNVLLRYSTRKR
jgi:hypothetical protein